MDPRTQYPRDSLGRMDRRTAVKWMFAAAATLSACGRAESGTPPPEALVGRPALTPSDPDLFSADPWWDRTLTPEQLRTVRTLCDVIIPQDERSPAASEVGVPDFIDEWVSAPYEPQQNHRTMILAGLVWLDGESQRRFGRDFHELEEAQTHAICDDVCYLPRARAEHREAARFFAVFRNLTAGGYYSTPVGMRDVGYVGNVPLASFDGAPAEVLQRLGLA